MGVDSGPVPELPATFAHEIVLGMVEAIDSFLSHDRTSIYTEINVRVERVFSSKRPIASGAVLAILVPGGTVQIKEKESVSVNVSGLGKPLQKSGRYVLFLDEAAGCDAFRLTKAWGLSNGEAVPLANDDQARVASGTSAYAGMSEPSFLDAVSKLEASGRDE